MRISILNLIYTIHFAYLKVYTKFHNLKSSRCWENPDEKCQYVLYMSGRRKIENLKKEDKNEFSIFIFIYTICLAYLKVYTKFENTGSRGGGGGLGGKLPIYDIVPLSSTGSILSNTDLSDLSTVGTCDIFVYQMRHIVT